MKDILTSLRLVALSILVCCVIYPAAIWALGRFVAPSKADGSLIRGNQGQVIGSALVAQQFTRPDYFWPRPSAANYNAAAATGSNLSPTSPLIRQQAQAVLDRLAPGTGVQVPTDLVTASGSGLDPHISFASALIQVPRVAQARGLTGSQVEQLVRQSIDGSSLQWFGAQPVVNVLELNLALDNHKQGGQPPKIRSN